MSVMDDLTEIPYIQSPLLYIFEGELIRISRTIAEVLGESPITGYGELYGLYTHSQGPVVHLAMLKKPNKLQLRQALSSRRDESENEYSLSLLGKWFAVQNIDISPRHLIQMMADTLSKNETTVCIVVNRVQDVYDFKDMSKNTHAFFLMEGKIFRMEIKIIKRESPFQFDCDFSERLSSAGYFVNVNETRLNRRGYQQCGTEMADMSGKSKPDAVTSNSDPSVNDLPQLKIESENLHCNDMLNDSKEDNAAGKSTSGSLSTKDDLITEDSNVESQKREENEKKTGANDETWVNIEEDDTLTGHETQNDEMDDKRRVGKRDVEESSHEKNDNGGKENEAGDNNLPNEESSHDTHL